MAVDVAVDRARTSSYKAVAVSCRARPGTAMQGRKVRSPLTAAPARSSREFSSLWPLPSSTRASRGPTANTTYLNTTDTLTRSTPHHTHTPPILPVCFNQRCESRFSAVSFVGCFLAVSLQYTTSYATGSGTALLSLRVSPTYLSTAYSTLYTIQVP